MTSNWRDNLINDPTQIRELLSETKTIAVLGIKTEAQSSQPAFYVPSYMQNAGFKIIPVPVYYPEASLKFWARQSIGDCRIFRMKSTW